MGTVYDVCQDNEWIECDECGECGRDVSDEIPELELICGSCSHIFYSDVAECQDCGYADVCFVNYLDKE